MATNVLKRRNQVLAVAIESAYGVAASPTGANVVLASDLEVTLNDGSTEDRNNVVGMLGSQGKITTSQMSSMRFGVEFAGSGDAVTPPAWGTLLKGCMMAEVVGASSVTYSLIDTDENSLTALYRNVTYQQRLIGSRGNFSVEANIDSVPKFKFDFQALFEAPTDESGPLSGIDVTPFTTPEPISASNTALNLFGSEVDMKTFTLNAGVDVKYDSNTGGESIEIKDRRGTVKIQFRTSSTQLIQAIDDASTNREGALQLVHGTQAGKTLTIDVPNIQVTSAKVAWVDDIAYVDMDADMRPTARNTDFTITQS